MATSDGGRARDGKEIPAGSIISCTTKFDEKYQGEVLAFDYGTKFLVIKIDSDKEKKKGNSDVKVFNISYLKNVEMIKESSNKTSRSLPALDLEKVDRRCKAKINEKMQAVNRVGIDVTPEGQKLYDTLAKQFTELQWNEKNIVVMNSVIIKPPYSTDSIYTEGKDLDAINYIKGVESTIGFIGLGNMGGPMAKNLIDSGHSVVVYDIFPKAVDELKQCGAQSAESPAAVASKAKKIITMLPSRTVQQSSLLIDCSTIDPSIAKEMNDLAKRENATYMDSPVSGGITAAKGATLTFMVGGEKEGFEQANTILQHMGKNVIHTGPVGTGQAAKICNNMLLAVSMIGVSEAMNLGINLGLDAKMIAKIINSSSGRCWSSEIYNPCPGVIEGVPSSNNYQGGFMTALMAKDLGLAQNASTSTKTPTPMGSLAHQIYRIMSNKGFDNLDFGSVFKYLQNEDGNSK